MRRRRALDDLDDDIRDHLARETAENVGRGMSPEEARRRALLIFGNPTLVREDARTVWGWRWATEVGQDLRYAVRAYARTPTLTTVLVATLALGIGANAAIFSVFDAVVLRPLPVEAPDSLVLFTGGFGEGTRTSNPPPTGSWDLFSTEAYRFLQHQPLPFVSLAAVRSGHTTVLARLPDGGRDTATAERAAAHLVSGNYFETMGVDAALGRILTADDDQPASVPVVVLSHAFWTQRLAAEPSVIGRVALLNDTALTIVGVAPREFFGERVRRAPDFWVPLHLQPQMEQSPSKLDLGDVYWLNLIGRLAVGATRAEAQVASTAALQRFLVANAGSDITEERQQAIRETRVELFSGAGGVSGLRQRYGRPLRILLGVVGLVFLVACTNVGSLLLARANARRPEMSIRAALGAGRARLVRQLMTESLLLAAVGGAGGLLLGSWVAESLIAVAAPGQPVDTRLGGSVFLLTLAITMASTLVFGVAPALLATRTDAASALRARSTSGTGRIARRHLFSTPEPLVMVQIAACLVLIVGATLLARSLLALEGEEVGFDAEHVLVANIYPRMAGYESDTVGLLYERLRERLAALPGVESATIARYSPFSGSSSTNTGTVQGYSTSPGENLDLETVLVGPSYAETLGIPVVQGRAIGPQDVVGGRQVGMVNETFVSRYLPGQNPIGRHFGIEGDDGTPDTEIIGVLADASFHGARSEIRPMVFPLPLARYGERILVAEIAVRLSPVGTTAGDIRRIVHDVDAGLPVDDPVPLQAQVARSYRIERLFARFVTAFSALALILACVGLYGMVTQAVLQRTSEIGVRMALGALRYQVLWMIAWGGLKVVLAGLLIGVPVALAAATVLSSTLFGVAPADPTSFAIGASVLGIVGTTTGLIPAWRAARIDPATTLRAE